MQKVNKRTKTNINNYTCKLAATNSIKKLRYIYGYTINKQLENYNGNMISKG